MFGGQTAARLLAHLVMPIGSMTLLQAIRNLPLPNLGRSQITDGDD